MIEEPAAGTRDAEGTRRPAGIAVDTPIFVAVPGSSGVKRSVGQLTDGRRIIYYRDSADDE